MKDIKSNLIEWDNRHKLYIKNYAQAKLYAYHKSFYFDVKLNGEKVKRQF